MAILTRALAARRANPFAQFGQTDDALTSNGATGCTDTCLQFLSKLIKNVWYSHNTIRRKVGHTNTQTGLNYSEVGAFCRAVGLPYVVKLGLTASQILSLAKTRGPVLVGELYSWHPEWLDYVYGGVKADGKPNGVASPRGKAGKNQLTGFTGRHAVLVLGVTTAGVYVMEPNHASPARPEKPPYDVMTIAQFTNLVNTYKASTGESYAVYPTKVLS